MADEIAYNIGSLPALPDGELLDTDMVEIERPGSPENSNFRMTGAELRAALGGGDSAQTGDALVTARDPGAGWLRQDTVYSQAAYPELFGLVGLIGGAPPGRIWSAQTPTAGITAAISGACWITDRIAVAVGNNAVWRTTDGGVNWVQIPVTGNLTAVARVSSSVVIACGGLGVILRSVDSGATWTAVSSGTTSPLYSIIVFTSARIYVSGGSSTARLSTDGGATFGAGTAPMTDVYRAVRFSDDVAVTFATSGTSAARTTNGGATWTTITIPTFNNARGGCAFNDMTGAAIGSSGQILRTADAGVTWTLSTLAAVASAHNLLLTGEGTAVAIVGNGNSYFTSDSGANWASVGIQLNGSQAAFAIPDAVAVAVGSGVQFRSLPEYDYDTGTQFKTPGMSGIGSGLTGYIKA